MELNRRHLRLGAVSAMALTGIATLSPLAAGPAEDSAERAGERVSGGAVAYFDALWSVADRLAEPRRPRSER